MSAAAPLMCGVWRTSGAIQQTVPRRLLVPVLGEVLPEDGLSTRGLVGRLLKPSWWRMAARIGGIGAGRDEGRDEGLSKDGMKFVLSEKPAESMYSAAPNSQSFAPVLPTRIFFPLISP